MKYALTDTIKDGLHQIVALKDFYDVSVGDLGGFISSVENLSQEGNAWVSGDAWVSGNARVYGDARVSGNAQVYGNALVSGAARVYGDAWVYGDAQVYGDAWVYGDARVYGNALVSTTPIGIMGLNYPVTITETHIFIGCQGHTKCAWVGFTDLEIAKMDGKRATDFWIAHKEIILKLAGVL